MRRSTKPFTVEVKKRGGRRRDGGDAVGERLGVASQPFDDTPGRNIRFRDAESLFRAPPPESGLSEPETVPLAVVEPFPSPADAAPRRILPDLIAEAALTEATQAAEPAPRRRGRPPKDRSGDHPQTIRKRKPVEPDLFDESVEPAVLEEIAPPPPPVLYLAASARRRANRATDNLPRAERWKRRLPKVCW